MNYTRIVFILAHSPIIWIYLRAAVAMNAQSIYPSIHPCHCRLSFTYRAGDCVVNVSVVRLWSVWDCASDAHPDGPISL